MSWCDDFLLEQSAKKLSGQEVVVTDNPQVIINGVNTLFSARCWNSDGVRIDSALNCAYSLLSGEKGCSDLGIFCDDIGVSGDLNGADVVLMANGVNDYCEAPLSTVNRYAKENLSSYPTYPKETLALTEPEYAQYRPSMAGDEKEQGTLTAVAASLETSDITVAICWSALTILGLIVLAWGFKRLIGILSFR